MDDEGLLVLGGLASDGSALCVGISSTLCVRLAGENNADSTDRQGVAGGRGYLGEREERRTRRAAEQRFGLLAISPLERECVYDECERACVSECV